MKATIVSFVPWEMKETKPGMVPGTFVIPKSDGKTPSVLVIEDANANIYISHERGSFQSPIPVDQLANSIVNDSVSAHLEIDTNARPGLFWVEGSFTAAEILKQFPEKCKEAIDNQNRWYMRLIKQADDMWSRFHQHRMISDVQRVAAQSLGLAKEWAIAPEPIILMKCPACTTMVESTAIVCKNCHAILKPEEAKKMGLAFAGA